MGIKYDHKEYSEVEKTDSKVIEALKDEIEEKNALLRKQSDEIEALKLETEEKKTLLTKQAGEIEALKKSPKKSPRKTPRKPVTKKTNGRTFRTKLHTKVAEKEKVEELEETIDLLIDEKEESEKVTCGLQMKNSELVNICRNMKEEIKALKTETGGDTNRNLTAKLKKTTEDFKLKTKELEKTVNAKHMLEKQLGIEIADRAKAEAAIRERKQLEIQLKEKTKMNCK